MLSPKLKRDIRTLWDRFWAGGIANPLTAIEQITDLVFLKWLEDLDDERAKEAQEANCAFQSIFNIPAGERYKWRNIRRLPRDLRGSASAQRPVAAAARKFDRSIRRFRLIAHREVCPTVALFCLSRRLRYNTHTTLQFRHLVQQPLQPNS